MVQADRFEPGWRHLPNIFSAMIFISVLLGLIDFSEIVMLRSGSNLVVANKTLSVLICLYYCQVCFHERAAMTVKQI